ncbi:MAG: extracellular solute-binding protein [Candidatus Magasanikbacteria bacterium]|nr:extracellular solute-binding protein [Candidatus Magasanikbacteria bacterium]
MKKPFSKSHTSFVKIVCLIVVPLITLGLGCKGPSSVEQAAIQPVVLNYWTVFNDVPLLRQLADEYTATKPYLTINIRQVRYEELDTLFVNALADDIAPDIISVHNRMLRKYQPRLSAMPSSVSVANVFIEGQYAQQVVVDVQPQAMPSLTTLKAAYISTVPDDITIGGQIYGLPLSVDTLAIYYNTDLLDRAGVATPPTTWEEFLDAVKKSTKFAQNGDIIQSGVAMGTGANISNSPDMLALLMMQKGLEITRGNSVLFNSDIRQLRSTHPALEALRFYTDFARPTKDVYSWNKEKSDALGAFTRGQSVFYVGYAFDQARIRVSAPQMNIGVIPIPQLDPSRPVNVANYWVESVVLKSQNRDVAWDFVRFITTPANVQVYTNALRVPSPYRQHIAAQSEDPLLAPFVGQILTAKNWYRGRNVDVADRALSNLIDAYLEPYAVNVAPDQRDVNLIEDAAAIIQQTM